MDNKPVSHVYIKIINILIIAVLLILNLSSFIASKEVNICFIQNILFVQHIYNKLIEISLIGVLLLINIISFRKDLVSNKKIEAQEEVELNKYQKEIDVQYKVLEKIASLYDNTVKCTNEKSEFFYNMSHELKTPITVILGAIQLIEQKKGPIEYDRRKSSKHITTIKQNCYRLLRLINNILDLSRIESGYIKSNMVNCNIVYLIEEICQSVIPYAEQKSLTLEFDTMEEEIITAVDVDKIERIILNLLSNAIKYTKPGGKISVVVSSRFEKVHICVQDTGIGIPKDMQKSVFERYQQVDSSLTKGIEGSGLGLSIVKSFVQLHDGSVKLKSEPNIGSEFHIFLPIKHIETASNIITSCGKDSQRIIEAINIEFSEIYHVAAETAIKVVGS
ncbi:MAG: Sensor histidine kinase TodS [Firmicutes bacterium ADurb.Bin419]|nr:MAG: Sensor histidine kinase TodS [Firmicutes bacterium ADurb.Bin419]